MAAALLTPSFVLLFPELQLLPGAGGRSPARRGAWGERGIPLYTPSTPYSPFFGNAKIVSLIGLYPVRRVSRGASARTFPALWPGDVRACCGAASPPRASGVAIAPRLFAPAAALRPPFGRPGSPSRPCHAASAMGAERCAPAGSRPQRGNNGGRSAGRWQKGKLLSQGGPIGKNALYLNQPRSGSSPGTCGAGAGSDSSMSSGIFRRGSKSPARATRR